MRDALSKLQIKTWQQVRYLKPLLFLSLLSCLFELLAFLIGVGRVGKAKAKPSNLHGMAGAACMSAARSLRVRTQENGEERTAFATKMAHFFFTPASFL